jgi:hypothetical protein
MAVGMPLLLGAKRGWAVGVVGAVVYGVLAFANVVARDRLVAWSSLHPSLDAAFFGPLLFLALAFLTNLPTETCVAIALLGGVTVVGLNGFFRARRI